MSDKRERRFKYVACGRKNEYAEAQARMIASRNRLQSYKCAFCDGWHVASTPEREAANEQMTQLAHDAKFAMRRRAR